MPKVTKGKNGVSLDFTQAGSYRYPRITRTSDGALIKHWHMRPFAGSIREAREAFADLATKGCNLDDVENLQNATEKQIIFVKRLNGLFEPADGGYCQLADRHRPKRKQP